MDSTLCLSSPGYCVLDLYDRLGTSVIEEYPTVCACGLYFLSFSRVLSQPSCITVVGKYVCVVFASFLVLVYYPSLLVSQWLESMSVWLTG